jgi:hypothetical protein
MAKKKVAELVLETLAQAGVERIYGISGDSLNAIIIIDHNLVQAIGGRSPLLVDGAEGMAAVDVVCRAYASQSSPENTLATASAGTR